jgi:hypothetical protein
MDHRKAERVSYHNGIQDFRSFGQSETQRLSDVPPLFCPETEFISEVDLQNSITSKPFVGWGWISNWWRDGRVFQLFGIQLRGRISYEQPKNLIFLRCCNLPRNAVFSISGHHSKIFTPRPSTVWGHVIVRWKPGRVLFDLGSQLIVRFCIEQTQCNFFRATAPDQGKTIVVRPHDGPCSDFISFFCIYVFIYIAHVILHNSDGVNYLVVDGANSLRKGRVWSCPWILNSSSWGIPSTCASTLSTNASSEPQATDGFA